MMDLFVVVFTTCELIPKGMLSLLLYPFVSEKNNTPMQRHLANYFTDYAKRLESTPFYQHDYEGSIKTLSEAWATCRNLQSYGFVFTHTKTCSGGYTT